MGRHALGEQVQRRERWIRLCGVLARHASTHARRAVVGVLLAGFGLLWHGAAQATVALSASFNPPTIVQGDRSLLTITFQNDDVADLTNAAFTVNLPAGLSFYSAAAPLYAAPATSCVGGTVSAAGVLSGGTVPGKVGNVNGTCTMTIDVTSLSSAVPTYTYNINPNDYRDDTNASAASGLGASLNVTSLSPPTVAKTFGTNTLTQGKTTNVTITLSNPNASAAMPLTTFTDNLPANLVLAAVPGLATTCLGGTPSGAAGASSVTLTGGTIAASSSCTVTFNVEGVLPANTASQAGANAFPAGAIGNTRGLTSPVASTNITVNSPISLQKGYNPTPLASGTNASFTFHIVNNSTGTLNNVGLADVAGWPSQIDNAAAISAANLNAACGGGTLVAGPGGANGRGFTLAGATLAPGADCTITFQVTSTTVGVWTNTVPAGAVTSTEGFYSPSVTAPLDVRNTALTVTKAVSPTTIAPGDLVTFTVAVTSYSNSPQAGVTFTDTLPVPMTYVDNLSGGGNVPTLSGPGCSALVRGGTNAQPQFTFDMPASTGAGAVCTVTFNARVPANANPGTTYTNSTGAVGNGTVGNGAGASAGALSVIQPLTVSKTFDGVAARVLSQGSVSQLEIILTNNNLSALAAVAFTDTLPTAPGQIRVANPANATSTCGGTLTANPGDTAISLAGGTIPARASGSPFGAGTCAIRVSVVGGAIGTHSNTIPVNAVTAQGTINNVPNTTVRNTNTTTATLQYTAALALTKTFLTNNVTVGGSSRVRIQINNNGASILTNVTVPDVLTGTGLALSTTPNASSTCAGPVVITAPAGGNTASIAGASVPAGGSCEFLFDVVTTTSTPSVNTIPAGSATADGGVSNSLQAQATLTKSVATVVLAKAFNPTVIASPGQTSVLTISLTNNGANPLTNLGIVDNMPAGMQIAAVPGASTTCAGGVVNATAGTATVSLSNGTLAAGATCQVVLNVTSLSVGTLTNTLPANIVTNTQGITNTLPFSANLSALAGLGIQKSFNPTSVPPNTRARLILQINNSLQIPLTAISGSDNLPAGLQGAVPPNASTTCTGATVNVTTNTLSFSGASLPVGPSNCTISVDVIAPAAGVYDNFIPGGSLIANGGGVTNPVPGTHAILNVLTPPTINKTFALAQATPGQADRVTITIANPNAGVALTNVSLVDTLPTGLFVAPTPNPATTCAGGTVNAVPSAASAQIAGATIPAAGSCTLQFDVVSNIAGLYVNTIPAGSIGSAEGVTNANPTSAQVRILTPPSVAKTFTPPSIAIGGTSRLTITLGNQTASPMKLFQDMDDTLPPTVVVAATPAIGGTCTNADITATAGSSLVRYKSGALIPAGGCTIQVNVTGSTLGTYNNTIPAGALVTQIGTNPNPGDPKLTNPSPGTGTLVVSPKGSISGVVYHDDNNDGLVAVSEQPYAGQTMQLLDALNTVIATTTTDASGFYAFTNLDAGTYTVRQVSQPAGSLSGKTTTGTVVGAGGGTPGTASAPTVSPSTISTIVLGTGGGNVSSSINNNFGEITASRLSGKVFRDDNNDGAVNGTEPALAGVPITLSGVDDLGQAVTLNTTTAADGTYSFTNLRPSCSPLNAPTCPGYVVTEGTQPTNTGNGITTAGTVVDLSSGAAVGTAGTGSNNAPAVGAAAPAPAIPLGTSRVTGIILPANASSPNNNFGELASNRTLSGRIFTDNNADGSVNGTDAGVGTGATAPNNVAQSLTLTGTDSGGNPVTLTTTTDATGNYSFLNVPPGAAYTVTCTTCNPPAGYANSPGPLGYPGSTGGAAGGTQAVPTITGINLAGLNTISVNNNFTKIPAGPLLGGRVYFDANNNGAFDTPADFGFANQTVELRDNVSNALIATTTTDANGYYLFTGFAPGTYKVVQPAQPANTADGKTHVGTVAGVASGTATPQNTTPSIISGIVIGANQAGANYDFPEIGGVTLGGRVYNDANVSSTFDGGDTGIAGVSMVLTGTDVYGKTIRTVVLTDAAGLYSFTGLLPGDYVVTELQPTDYVSVANTTGTVTGGTAGAVGPLGGAQETQSVSITAVAGSAPNINFGERCVACSIRGFKSVANQARPGSQPVTGDIVIWTISYRNESGATTALRITDIVQPGLTLTGAPAITISSTGGVTNMTLNGAYNGVGVTDLLNPAATFDNGAVVTIKLPMVVTAASGTLNNQAVGNTTTKTSQVDTTTPGLPAGVVVPANSLPQPSGGNLNNLVPTIVNVGKEPAAVSGTVWLDNDSDRRQGAGDTLLAGWGVAVYDASGKIVQCSVLPKNTTTDCITLPGSSNSLFKTNASGAYGVTGLQPGNYKIEFHDPTNNIVFATPMNSGNDPNSHVANTRDSLSITLASGQSMVQQDLPIDPSGVVYDSNTRAPIPGAKVQMCGPAGFNPATMLVGGAAYVIAGNCATMTTGATGLYQFLLTPTAPAGTYSLTVTAPSYTPSTLITPSPGPYTPAGASPVRVQVQAGPPPVGQPTTYYMSFNLGPGTPDLIHNHIPLDPFSGSGLFLQKSVDRDTVEIGDSVQYTLRLSSPAAAATNVHIVDNLPAGFRLIPGTVIQDGVKVADPSGSPGPTLDFVIASVPAATPVVITYRLRVGVGAQQGNGTNRARASGTSLGASVSSNEARARVKITSGVFFEESCVVGKIFVDCNNNRIQDPEELGIPGVRFYLHDGTYLISDVEGKYSYCGLPARTGVIKADSTTLPLGSQLVTSSNRNALDANSLFLDLQKGELHRADFIEGSCGPNVLEQVKARRAKGSVAAPIVEKKPQPKLIFESGGSIRKSIPKERDDVMRSCPAGQCNAPAGNSITPASGVTGGAK